MSVTACAHSVPAVQRTERRQNEKADNIRHIPFLTAQIRHYVLLLKNICSCLQYTLFSFICQYPVLSSYFVYTKNQTAAPENSSLSLLIGYSGIEKTEAGNFRHGK